MSKILRRWRYRINRHNLNLLIIICGATGSGKSFTGLTLGKLIDPTFEVAERVVFNAEQFMDLLRSDRLKRGNVVIWDEAGIGIPAREWYSISNKAINYIFQTFRYKNLCMIMTTPSFDFLDAQTRKLFHVYIETDKIDYATQRVICKVMENQFNPAMGKEYRKYFYEDGIKQERISIGKPTPKMIKEYESLKRQFAERLEIGVHKDLKLIADKETKRRLTDEEIQEDMKKRKEKGERLTIPEAQRIFGIGHDRAAFNIYAVWGKRRQGMWGKEN